MIPILLCSITAMAICIERSVALKQERVAPKGLLREIWEAARKNQFHSQDLRAVRAGSPLGQILATGLENSAYGRELMKESIEEATAQAMHELERYLTTLGTIAGIAPLLGLLGTVIGMMKVFDEIMAHGTGNANVLAGGISEALITTAAGIGVAIPTLMFHRLFMRRVDELALHMHAEATRLVEAFHANAGKTPSVLPGEDGWNPDTFNPSAANQTP